MKSVRRVSGRALPLDRANVDTDQIIPAHWLKRTARTGYAAGLFEAWRRDPSFVMNDPRYAGASILIAGANFGSGSSREHAVWALEEAGFRAVIAPKLAEIFRANCLKSGVVPVEVDAETVTRLMRAVERDPSTEIVVDVERGIVAGAGARAPFRLDAYARERLIEGLDDIAVTLAHEDEIAAYEARRPEWLPRVQG
ncbi:MAG TPA: 3-isopropylmalate dehydratase small subunit [Candidatus Limnocylindria bacterium]|jgi:3-isopropylmalate/(R)-2-methylmalate dehydratase small subunit|nr:3-isopropylmalate dehydratase small subunit [Candidatus Limnocylindria bacterium]